MTGPCLHACVDVVRANLFVHPGDPTVAATPSPFPATLRCGCVAIFDIFSACLIGGFRCVVFQGGGQSDWAGCRGGMTLRLSPPVCGGLVNVEDDEVVTEKVSL